MIRLWLGTRGRSKAHTTASHFSAWQDKHTHTHPHLLGLHLKATADGVERVRGIPGRDGHRLRDPELGEETLEALVILEGVLLAKRVVQPEVHATVPGKTWMWKGGFC